MRVAAAGQRRGQDQADGAEQRAAGDRHDQHGERMDAQRGAERDRLHELLEDPVGQQLDDGHADRGLVPAPPSATRTPNAPALQAPRYGM